MPDINSHKIPYLSVERIIEILTQAYVSALSKGVPVANMPATMIWGAPGLGKSQLVRQIARNLKDELGLKDCIVNDVRLILFNPVDLRGIPTVGEDKKSAVWLQPDIFNMNASKDVYYILFLDEISAAAPSVQAAAYQIALDRKIGEHKLPDNVIVICAGNRTTDKSVAYTMPKALANRMMHFNVESSFTSWKKWAVEHGIHKDVVGFLSFRQDYLLKNEVVSDEFAYATPRTWEMVSNVLYLMPPNPENILAMISGLIGTGMALEFKSYLKIHSSLPAVEEIFNGKCTTIPNRPDALYALCSSMIEFAREHQTEKRLIENSITYAKKMPPDFTFSLMKDYMAISKEFKMLLMTIPAFVDYVEKMGGLLNGVV